MDKFKELSEQRKKWVEASQENNFEAGLSRLLTGLYPEKAHFIYELLQNAEDAKASEVTFILNDNSVEFEHDGRPFALDDIKAITGIGISTKSDDYTKIGKFGVGFKAVFAYTQTPEIHSKDYHFRISALVVPESISPLLKSDKKSLTRFLFPFNNPQKLQEKAREEIERNLRQLNENTLLFLSNIRKIEYLLPDATNGFLERSEKEQNRIEIAIKHPEDDKPTSTCFLRFEKNVEIIDKDETSESAKQKHCKIAIAFKMLEKSGNDNSDETLDVPKKSNWKIIPAVPGQVCIYFPAEKETSNLYFHLHAPFASTVARDSIRDCDANNELRNHLAELIAEAMTIIRDQKLLTVNFLSVLPNNKDNLSSFYKPIQDSLIKIFRSESLTPMKQGNHAAASGIFRGQIKLSNLISDNNLAKIMGDDFFPPMWVANPPQKNQREDNFLSSLGIEEWSPEDLIETLKRQTASPWLSEKTDEWHQELYAFLKENDGEEKLKPYRIVRTSSGTYKRGEDCFFSNDGNKSDALMPCVATGVYASGENEQEKKKAKEFLTNIGVREIGEIEKVESILKHRYATEAQILNWEIYISDLKCFINCLYNTKRDDLSKIKNMLEKYSIFKSEDNKWHRPKDIYLDAPFRETNLTAYYKAIDDIAHKHNLRQPLSSDYISIKDKISLDEISSFAVCLGAQEALNIKKDDLRRHKTDYRIDYLEEILQFKNIQISKLIWNACSSKKDSDYLYMQTRGNANCYFRRDGASTLITILKRYEWIPQQQPDSKLIFTKPIDADPSLLPEGFQFDHGWEWIKVLEFGASIRLRKDEETREMQRQNAEYRQEEEVLKKYGLTEIAEFKQKDPEGFDYFFLEYKERNNKRPPCELPTRPVQNPERRKENMEKSYNDAPQKEYIRKETSQRESRGTIDDPKSSLTYWYKLDTGEMICQICRNEMPFKKRHGDEYYFEKIEAFTGKYFLKENESQWLALCPVCAAKYKEFIKYSYDTDELKSLKKIFYL